MWAPLKIDQLNWIGGNLGKIVKVNILKSTAGDIFMCKSGIEVELKMPESAKSLHFEFKILDKVLHTPLFKVRVHFAQM